MRVVDVANSYPEIKNEYDNKEQPPPLPFWNDSQDQQSQQKNYVKDRQGHFLAFLYFINMN